MTPNDYQKLALRTADYNKRFEGLKGKTTKELADSVNSLCNNLRQTNWAMGLAGEAGEVCDYIKKVTHHGHKINRDHIKKELGDVCWYVAVMAHEYGITMNDVLESNIEKLRNRYPEGFSSEASKNRQDHIEEETK